LYFPKDWYIKHPFVLICSQVFFGEMSIHLFVNVFWWVAYLIESWGFLKYSTYKSLFSYVFDRYFLPVCCLFSYLREHKIFTFDGAKFKDLSLHYCAFGVLSKNLCQAQDLEDFLFCHFLDCFIVFTFKSVIHLEWVLVSVWGEGLSSSCIWIYSCPSIIC
jgi:hypothetical protein